MKEWFQTPLCVLLVQILEEPAEMNQALGLAFCTQKSNASERYCIEKVLIVHQNQEGKIDKLMRKEALDCAFRVIHPRHVPGSEEMDARISEMIREGGIERAADTLLFWRGYARKGRLDQTILTSAIRLGNKKVIKACAPNVELNDADGCSTSFYETEAPEIRGLLKCLGAVLREDHFQGDPEEYILHAAVQWGCVEFLTPEILDRDLNNDEGYCPYLYETDDPEIQNLLLSYGGFAKEEEYKKYLFAYQEDTEEVLTFKPELRKAAFAAYLEENELSREEIIEILKNQVDAEECENDDFDDEEDEIAEDMHRLGVRLCRGRISFTGEIGDEDGYEIFSLLNDLNFEMEEDYGGQLHMQTNGIHYIASLERN